MHILIKKLFCTRNGVGIQNQVILLSYLPQYQFRDILFDGLKKLLNILSIV